MRTPRSRTAGTCQINFESDFLPKLGFRADGFRAIFKLLEDKASKHGPLVVVETGCVRKENSWETDGSSTIMFDAFAHDTGSTFITIDINPENCHLARRLCPHTTVLCRDSVAALYALRDEARAIDFLYLDSLDLDWQQPHPSALHHLKELCAAAPLLKSGSVVFVDDNQAGVGKGMYVRDFMQEIGARTLHDGYQLGFIMP